MDVLMEKERKKKVKKRLEKKRKGHGTSELLAASCCWSLVTSPSLALIANLTDSSSTTQHQYHLDPNIVQGEAQEGTGVVVAGFLHGVELTLHCLHESALHLQLRLQFQNPTNKSA